MIRGILSGGVFFSGILSAIRENCMGAKHPSKSASIVHLFHQNTYVLCADENANDCANDSAL